MDRILLDTRLRLLKDSNESLRQFVKKTVPTLPPNGVTMLQEQEKSIDPFFGYDWSEDPSFQHEFWGDMVQLSPPRLPDITECLDPPQPDTMISNVSLDNIAEAVSCLMNGLNMSLLYQGAKFRAKS
jgi:hypothetical protein